MMRNHRILVPDSLEWPSVVKVKGLIINKDNNLTKIFLIRTEKSQNLWTFTGGTSYSNESPRECLKRKVKEELGIEDSDIGNVIVTDYKFGFDNVEPYMSLYELKIFGEIKPSEKVIEYGWFNIGRINNLGMTRYTNRLFNLNPTREYLKSLI